MAELVFFWNGSSGSLQDRYGHSVSKGGHGESRDTALFQAQQEFMRLYPNYYSSDIEIVS